MVGNINERYCFIFDRVYLLYYKYHKINTNRGGSYIDSPDRIKNKKPTINPINKNYTKCFHYAETLASNHKEIGKIQEEYNWEGTNYPSEKDDWKNFESNNLTIALNVLYAKKEKNISCLRFKT